MHHLNVARNIAQKKKKKRCGLSGSICAIAHRRTDGRRMMRTRLLFVAKADVYYLNVTRGDTTIWKGRADASLECRTAARSAYLPFMLSPTRKNPATGRLTDPPHTGMRPTVSDDCCASPATRMCPCGDLRAAQFEDEDGKKRKCIARMSHNVYNRCVPPLPCITATCTGHRPAAKKKKKKVAALANRRCIRRQSTLVAAQCGHYRHDSAVILRAALF